MVFIVRGVHNLEIGWEDGIKMLGAKQNPLRSPVQVIENGLEEPLEKFRESKLKYAHPHRPQNKPQMNTAYQDVEEPLP